MSQVMLPGVLYLEDLEIDGQEPASGTLRLLEKLRPAWCKEDITIKVLTEGIVNLILKCLPAGDKAEEDGIVVRIYGQGTDFFCDRQSEMVTITVLHNIGYARPLYAKFKNGIAYGYAPGECLDVNSVRDDHMASMIAKLMVKMHSVHPYEMLPSYNLGNLLTKPEAGETFLNRHFFKGWLKIMPDNLPPIPDDLQDRQAVTIPISTKEEARVEMEMLQSEIMKLDSPIVFCHNDIHQYNIIYNRGLDKIYIIDCEFSSYNYEAMEIAKHFWHYQGIRDADFNRYPDKEYQLKWLRRFLQYQTEENDQPADSVEERDVERLYVTVCKYGLFCQFFSTMWVLANADKTDRNFNYVSFGYRQLDSYFKRKEEFSRLEFPE